MYAGNRYVESVTRDGELFNKDRTYRTGELQFSAYVRSIPPHAELNVLDLPRIKQYIKKVPCPALIKDVTNQRLSAWLAMQLPEAPVFVMVRHAAEVAWSMQRRFYRQDPRTTDAKQAERAMSLVLELYRRLFDGLEGRDFVTISVFDLAQDDTRVLRDVCTEAGIEAEEFNGPSFDRSNFDKYNDPNFNKVYLERYRVLREKELTRAGDGMYKLLSEQCIHC